MVWKRVRLQLTGQKFGRLEVIAFHDVLKGYSRWLCKCDCGQTAICVGRELRKGNRTGCGNHPTVFKHGFYAKGAPPEYSIWYDMLRRCYAAHRREAQYYLARGIKVCDRWRNSFENFLADMGPRPSPELSIDRINNDGDYEPGNCRWATHAQQGANRRPRQRNERL